MRLETRQFGEVDYDETQLVTFPQGIAGFEEYTRYLLVETEDYLPFLLLLSVEEPEVGFPIVPTSAVWEGYAPAVPDEELKVLELAGPGDKPMVFCIVTLGKGRSEITANLRAPIYMNTAKRIGAQVIVGDDSYPIRHEILTA